MHVHGAYDLCGMAMLNLVELGRKTWGVVVVHILFLSIQYNFQFL